MGSGWRKLTEYLGLAPDEDYDDVDAYDEVSDRSQSQVRQAPRPVATRPVSAVPEPEPQRTGSVRALPINPRPVNQPEFEEEERLTVRPTGPVVVRPPEQAVVARPQVVSPTSFAAAQEVADRFKSSRPVIMNLQGLDRDLARRLIDFASGLCYGLGGQMDKVANHVFLLTPADVKVPEEERRRLTERGLTES